MVFELRFSKLYVFDIRKHSDISVTKLFQSNGQCLKENASDAYGKQKSKL